MPADGVTDPNWIVTAEPRCATLLNAVATPFELVPRTDWPDIEVPRGFKMFTRGCLYDSDGGRVDLSVRIGGVSGDQTRSVDPAVLEPHLREGGLHLAGRTLYVGTFMNHYGHFITEMLSRCWWEEAAMAFDHIVAYPFIHDDGSVMTRPFHRYLAGLLDIPIDRVEILTQQTRFDEIVVPEQLWAINTGVNAHMREIYGRISRRHAAKKSYGRVFLSRKIANSKRLDNPPEVEEVFAGYGFDILYPEQIPIERQMEIYANCEVLAGLSGSAMHNALFARPGLMTIEVGDRRTRERPVTMQRMVNALAQVEAHFIPFGPGEQRTIAPKKVRKQLVDILGERPTFAPVLALRARRLSARLRTSFKAWRKRARQKAR